MAVAAPAGSGRKATDEVIQEAAMVGSVALREVLVATGRVAIPAVDPDQGSA